MKALLRGYGPGLTGLLSLLVAIWVFGLILVPQFSMLDLSLWTRASPGEISTSIDKLYNETSILQLDIRAETDAMRKQALEATLAAKKSEIALLEAQEKSPAKEYSLANYTRMSGLHARIFFKTLGYAVLVTVLALIMCYPVAYALALGSGARRAFILAIALAVPYTMNELLRVYAWLMILDYKGLINAVLVWLGWASFEAGTAIPFLEYSGSTFAALVYAYILFMVFPIASTLETLDRHQIEAAHDLGAGMMRIHARIIIPHAKPGIAVGCIMTFMLAASSFSVPQIMTRGTGGDWFTQLIYRQFYEANNWNIGSAYAVSLMLVCLLMVGLLLRLFRVRLGEIIR